MGGATSWPQVSDPTAPVTDRHQMAGEIPAKFPLTGSLEGVAGKPRACGAWVR